MKISHTTSILLQEEGYDDIQQYLEFLSDAFGIRFGEVEILAETLGEDELFDGLITALEDYDIYNGFNPNEYEEGFEWI